MKGVTFMQTKMKYLSALAVAMTVLSTGLAAQTTEAPDMKVIDPNLPPQKAATDVVKKAAIPFVPFLMIDPSTGKVVLPDDIITLYDGAKVKAKEYYGKLNEMEQKLNAWGYSIKNNDDYALVTKILVDYGLITEQGKLSDELRAAFDPAVMERLKDPAILERILKDEVQKRAESYLEDLYRDTLLNDIKDLGIPNMKVDPKMISKANAELKTLVTKYVSETWGDEKIAISGNAKLNLAGDTKDFEALGQAVLKGQVYGNSFDIFFGEALGKAKQDEKLHAKLYAWALGKELLKKDIYSSKVWNKSERPSDTQPIKFSLKDLGIEGPLKTEIRQAIPVEYSYGIFSLKGEFGYNGAAGVNAFKAVAPSNVTGSFGPYQKLGSFASVKGEVGFGPVKVAEAGITGQIDIIDGSTTFQGGMKMDFQNGEAVITTEARGVSVITAMKGSMSALAKVKVPKASLPPWEEKTFEHVIYNSKGYSSGEMVLFDYKKVVGKFGFSLSKAADAKDSEGVNIDEELKNHFRFMVNDINAQSGVVEEKTRTALTNLESDRVVYLKFLEGLKRK
jgi:hypothetical protein